MLSIIRSPLPSPALRTMAAASSHIATPSPLSHPSYSSLPHTCLSTSMKTPKESEKTTMAGNSGRGGYFNLVGTSTTPCRFSVPCSPACGSLTPSPISPSISSISLSQGGSNNNAVKQFGRGRLNMISPSSQANLDEYSFTSAKSIDAQARRKPTFKLALPRPSLPRNDSSSLNGSMYPFGTPGTPYQLTWSDSFDSVMTLKPIKGRVPTPYPKMDDSEWIEDAEEAIAKM